MKRILLLPGLGDVHWVFLKLQSWLERQGPEWTMPEIHIWDIDNRPRTLDYLAYIPWVKRGDYFILPLVSEKKRFDSLYTKSGSPDVIFNFRGFDAFIGTNGNMRNGVSYEHLLQGAAINYGYGPILPAQNYGRHQKSIGPYFVLCFSGFGMFQKEWCEELTPEKLQRLLSVLKQNFPHHRFLFTGCQWDDAYTQKCMRPWDVSLVGKTTLPQLLSLLQHSSGYLGWCGGNSILSQHLGTPTVVWWSRDYFPKHDRIGWETPWSRKKHLVLDVEDYSFDRTVPVITKFLEECGA